MQGDSNECRRSQDTLWVRPQTLARLTYRRRANIGILALRGSPSSALGLVSIKRASLRLGFHLAKWLLNSLRCRVMRCLLSVEPETFDNGTWS